MLALEGAEARERYIDGCVSKVEALWRLGKARADVSTGQRQPASTVEQLPAQGRASEYAVRLGPQGGDAGDVGGGHARSLQPTVENRPRETGVDLDPGTRNVHRSMGHVEPSVGEGSRP